MPTNDLLAALPTIQRTRELTRALAVLDTVMSADWESRYYSYDPGWADGAQLASMRNGSGDDWFCWFGAPGAAIVGFAHESSMSPYGREPKALWPGLLDDVPDTFRSPVLDEPAFSIADSTFVIWRQPGDAIWRAGPIEHPDEADPDGAADLLELLVEDAPTRYAQFAGEYYERDVDIDVDAVAEIYRGTPLTGPLIAALNADRIVEAARSEVAATGYPTA